MSTNFLLPTPSLQTIYGETTAPSTTANNNYNDKNADSIFFLCIMRTMIEWQNALLFLIWNVVVSCTIDVDVNFDCVFGFCFISRE